MKKELDITRIMDDYTDNEFSIEGELAVDEEKAVTDLLAQVKPERKKMKPLFKVLIAAAAAAVLAGTVTAGTLVLSGSFVTPTDLDVSYWPEGNGYNMHIDSTHEVYPIKVEEGNRLFFIADGEYTDITDLVDANTPYIYSYVNTEGYTCYVIVGGKAGDYGYFDLYTVGDSGDWSAAGHNERAPEDQWIYIPEGTEFDSEEELYEAVREEIRSHFKAWCLAAYDELGLWDLTKIFSSEGNSSEEFNESIGYVYPVESEISSEE